jgi:hypothetical protein
MNTATVFYRDGNVETVFNVISQEIINGVIIIKGRNRDIVLPLDMIRSVNINK